MKTDENTHNRISWWMYLLKGILLIVLGIWMLKMPGESINAILLIIGLIVALGGALETLFTLYYRKALREWGWNLSAGILDLIIGIFLIANPDAVLLLITLFISFWLIVRGVLALWEAMELRKEGSKKWTWVLLLGILIILLAIILVWHPRVVGLTILFWIAISIISLGIFRIVLSFKLLRHTKSQ